MMHLKMDVSEKQFYTGSRSTGNVISEYRRKSQMALSNNTSTSITNVQQKTVFYSKDTIQNMEWTQEQQEILQDQLEEQVANEEYYGTLDEPHGWTCNCLECN